MNFASYGEKLLEALLHAFTPAGFQELLRFDFDEMLDHIASGGTYRHRVFEVVQWAESQGKLEVLFQAALKRRPENPKLKALAQKLKDEQGGSLSTDENQAVRSTSKRDKNHERVKTAGQTTRSPEGAGVPDPLGHLKNTPRDTSIIEMLQDKPERMLPRYEKLFSFFAGAQPVNFDQILTEVEREMYNTVTCVSGYAGTGKSTLLACLLVQQLERYRSGRSQLYPIYVHLRRFSEGLDVTVSNEEAVEILRKEVEALFTAPEAVRSKGQMLIVDGWDEYYRHPRQTAIREQYLRYAKRPKVAKIVGVGQGTPTYPGFKEVTADLTEDRSDTITLCRRSLEDLTIEGEAPALDELISAYLAVAPSAAPQDLAQRMKKVIVDLRLTELDLFILSLVETAIRRKWNLEEGGLGVLYYSYCEDEVRRRHESAKSTEADRNQDIKKLAAYVYSVYVAANVDVEEDFARLLREDPRFAFMLASMPHIHSTVMEFLIAEHAVEMLLQNRSLPDAESSIYPYGTNRFVRAIINRRPAVQRQVLDRINIIIDEAGIRQKTHLTYLLGRLRDENLHREAIRLLQTQLRKLEEGAHPSMSDPAELTPADRSWLLLQRTIYISLAYLEEKQAASRYIDTMLKEPLCDNLNRGFHLQYYEDLPRPGLSEELIAFDDIKVAPKKTFEVLLGKLRKDLREGKRRAMSSIELYTLCSMCVNRHVVNRLAQHKRVRLLELMDDLKTAAYPGFPAEHVPYLEGVGSLLKQEKVSVGEVTAILFRLKTQPRVGWTWKSRDGSIVRACPEPESVAEHTWGCVMLAEMFLPEASKEEGYNKAEIIRMLLLHDLPEAITGDKAAPEKTKSDTDQEHRVMMQIVAASTITSFNNMHTWRARWDTLRQRSSSINAQIAADIDLLENYLQMRIYLEKPQVSIPDAQKWASDIQTDLKTKHGREIFEALRHAGASLLSWHATEGT